jgi:osmoprotectant transport system substrate-binding protein
LALVAALALTLAACGSSSKSSTTSTSSSSALPGSGRPAITIGDKNFAEEYVLGNLYAEALRNKGFTAKLVENIGSSELIWKAAQSGQIEMYPEYTGTLLSAVAEHKKEPTSEQGAYEEAKAFVEKNGFTLLEKTPFSDSDAIATLPGYAETHHLSSIADLKPLGKSLTLGGPAEFATRFLGLEGLKAVYGVVPTFKPFAIELSYKALEGGQSDAQVVFTTDGQLVGDKFKVLSDPKHLFGFQNVAPVVTKSLASREGPAFTETVNKVSKLLTVQAMQQMNKAVTIEKQSPGAVARQFLSANGLG